jgi:hypothetical protein
MPDQNELHDFRQGDFLEAADLNALVALARRMWTAPNMAFDVDGYYQRPATPSVAPEWKFGKLNGDLAGGAGKRVSASVWKLNDAGNAWESAGDDLDDVYAPPLLSVGDTLDSGTWVIVHKHSDGKWYVTNAACA